MVFVIGLGKEYFIEMILEALLRSMVCKNEIWVASNL